MANATITSLAILTVNWEDRKKGYLDNFVPFLVESIRHKDSEVISANDMQASVQAEFGLRLPINTIKSLLPDLEREGYIRLQSATNLPNGLKTYTPNWDKLQEFKFQQIQQDVLRQHEELIESFISFCGKKFNESLEAEAAEEGLLSYLTDSGLHMISMAAHAAVIPFTQDHPQKSVRYLVGAFIQHLQNTSSPALHYLETVVKGYMLANAVFLPDVTVKQQKLQKFRSTQVYFDTSFLLFALGYAGEARKEPCLELLDLLREAGAQLRCFRHTLQEADSSLYALEQKFLNGQLKEGYGPSLEYFLTQRYRASDIAVFRQTLEKDLSELQIFVMDKPTYVVAPYQIDEEQLEKELAQAITYHNQVALERDVDSISAIMRLRRGEASHQIEDCKALFITPNAALARIAREFCHREFDPAAIPPCLTDHVVTTLVWLKKPLERPQLPMKRIIADCYAATQPDDRLWAKYMAEIERREQMSSREFTPEEYALLKYSTEAHAALMEQTLGDEKAFTTGTVPEILKIVRSEIQRETLVQLEEERKLRQEEKRAEDARQERVRQRAQKVANVFAKLLRWGLWIVLLAAALSVAPWGLPLSQTSIIRTTLAVLAGLLGMFAFLNLMYSTPLDDVIKRVEKYIGKEVEQWLRNITQ